MSSTQHQLIEQCATRLRGIVDALDNIHDTSPHRWSTDLDDVHSSAESLLSLIKDQAPTQAAQGLAGAALAQPSPKCATCGGTGMVDDGEITCSEGGIPYENGPVKCVKDCPACKAQPSPVQPEEAPVIGCLCGMPMTEGHHSPDGCSSLEEFATHSDQAQHSVPRAWLDVQAERRRQVEAEGWTPEHDDEHSHGQMARAAACYALAGSSAPNDGTAALLVSLAWPWDQQWWKPSTPRRDLVKACALALAEIERLDRACISQSPQPGATTASS
ncbi:TPA: hypothetical protein ACRNIQ_000133 [Pseudomonas aeruginosa]|uniref:hypothetical protein n=1 Tax=Pseudomonas aeruginosa TaxID=287 RepID=UPI0003B975BB|nr:hypothetical protein [Pseudomonas aeruginosa]ERV18821.1 hypothetical protein Q073_01743 [Pseudomonas aeruginosa BL19]PTZ19346.1 hypothetical protein DB385_04100 [Pseudomonas aeruginosa]